MDMDLPLPVERKNYAHSDLPASVARQKYRHDDLQCLRQGRNMGTGILQWTYGPPSVWLGGNTGTGIFPMSVARYKYGHRHLQVSVVRQKYGQGILQCMW